MREQPMTVLDRAFRVLAVFREDTVRASLADIMAVTNLPKSTVHRLVRQLTDLGALERIGSDYRLGLRLFELGNYVAGTTRLREVALPFMQDLYDATHETVHLAVLDGTDVLYLHRIFGHKRREMPTPPGSRMPAHCTALGKALLAFSNPEMIDSVISRGLRPYTTNTIATPSVLVQQLSSIRQNGIAYDREEAVLGVRCVSTPILNTVGIAVAAISIAGASNKILRHHFDSALRTAALGISRSLPPDTL